MKYEVIDNFLDEEYFNNLVSLLGKIPWYYYENVASVTTVQRNIFYLYHYLLQLALRPLHSTHCILNS